MVQPDRPHIAMLYGACAWRARYIMFCFEHLTPLIYVLCQGFSNAKRKVKELVGQCVTGPYTEKLEKEYLMIHVYIDITFFRVDVL